MWSIGGPYNLRRGTVIAISYVTGSCDSSEISMDEEDTTASQDLSSAVAATTPTVQTKPNDDDSRETKEEDQQSSSLTNENEAPLADAPESDSGKPM